MLLGGYAFIALSVLILVFAPVSRSLTVDRTLFVLAMIDVMAIFGFKLLSPGGHIPLLMMAMVPRMAALDLSGPRAAVVLAFAFTAFVLVLQDPLMARRLGWPAESAAARRTSAVAGSAKNLWFDHGVICGQTASAMQACENERDRAGNTMSKVSDALAENLLKAAASYATTDEQASQNIARFYAR